MLKERNNRPVQAAKAIPVTVLTPRYTATFMTDPSPDMLCGVLHNPDGMTLALRLPVDGGRINVTVPVRIGEPDGDFDKDGVCQAIRRFGMRRIGPRTWLVTPSVVQATIGLHAFVVCTWMDEEPGSPFYSGEAVPGGAVGALARVAGG